MHRENTKCAQEHKSAGTRFARTRKQFEITQKDYRWLKKITNGTHRKTGIKSRELKKGLEKL
jgi:hypothetical protein